MLVFRRSSLLDTSPSPPWSLLPQGRLLYSLLGSGTVSLAQPNWTLSQHPRPVMQAIRRSFTITLVQTRYVYEYVRRSDGSYWYHLREHKELYWHQRVGIYPFACFAGYIKWLGSRVRSA
jgi:hypothetical protein